MSSGSITLPCLWAGSTYISTGARMGAIRLGGVWRDGYVFAEEYLSFAKFDFSELIALGLKAQHIQSAKLWFVAATTNKTNRVGLYQMLKAPVSGQFSWTQASNGGNWQTAGAKGSTDRGTYYAGPELPIGNTTHNIPLSGADIIALQSGTQSIGFYTLDLGSQQFTAPYSEIQTFNVNIQLSYRKSSLAGDVTMF